MWLIWDSNIVLIPEPLPPQIGERKEENRLIYKGHWGCRTFSLKGQIVNVFGLPWWLRWWSNAGDPGSIPGSGRAPGEENEYSLQCSCLRNPMDTGSWWATIHSVVRVEYDWATFHFSLSELKGCFCLRRNSGKFWISGFLASPKSVPVSSSNTSEFHYIRALWQSP